MKRFTILFGVLGAALFSGCELPREREKLALYPAYEKVIPADRVSDAAAWVTATLATQWSEAEDTEDNIEAATAAALDLFGVTTWGMRSQRNGVWTFTPYEFLSPAEKRICDEDRPLDPQGHRHE